MISKYIPANSFYHTCRYICNKPGAMILVTEDVREHDYKLMAADLKRNCNYIPPNTRLVSTRS